MFGIAKCLTFVVLFPRQVFSIWDRLFGSFMPEKEKKDAFRVYFQSTQERKKKERMTERERIEAEALDTEPMYYGVVPPLRSWNPLYANFHHFYHMIFIQPEWHGLLSPFVHWTPPNGKCPKLGSAMNSEKKFNAYVRCGPWKVYIGIQFLTALVALFYFLIFGGSELDILICRLFSTLIGVEIDEYWQDTVGTTLLFLLLLWKLCNVSYCQSVTADTARGILYANYK